jgi:hypothetical protein
VGGGPVLYHGSMPDVVNTVGHLWLVSLPLSALLSSSALPDPGLGASSLSGSGHLQGRRFPHPPADRWSPVVWGSFSHALSDRWVSGARDLLPDNTIFPKIDFVSLRCGAGVLINSTISSVQELKPLFVGVPYIIFL